MTPATNETFRRTANGDIEQTAKVVEVKQGAVNMVVTYRIDEGDTVYLTTVDDFMTQWQPTLEPVVVALPSNRRPRTGKRSYMR